MLILNFLIFFFYKSVVTGLSLSDTFPVAKIIGGHDTNITDVPWQLLHLINGDQGCGGVIIGPREVLTAAHCYALGEPDNPSANQYRAGSNNRLSGGTIHAVESFMIHPEFNYSADYITHDIAFVRVNPPFEFSDSVQPIEIGTDEPKDGESALISGWGVFIINGTEGITPIILQSTILPVVERNKCREWYSDYFWEIREDMLCVGVDEGEIGSCNGDSGGPMVVGNKLVGVMSWMDPCAKPHHPSVYTSVPYYYDWIKEMLAS